MDSVIVLSDSVVKDVSSDFFVQDVAVKAGDEQLGDMPLVNDTSDIEKFFSRPIRIASYSWNVGAVPFFQIDPWTAFITNARVAEKLAWFSRLRGKLVLRCNVSATPYHYGLARFCYRAHPGSINTGDPVYNFAVALESNVYTESMKVVSSQLPGVFINPGYITSAEISAPYVHFQPGIELQVSGCASEIGTLMFIGFKALQTANGSMASATVDFYAHMEDVVLDVPTAMHQGFTMSDVRRVVSRTFTIAAKATALAGEWVPRVMSAAAMLGFSRPLSHDVPIGVRAQPFLLSNYDAPDTCESLALSASTEQALGGQGLSVAGKDELVLEAIVGRPTYIAQNVWTSAMANSEFVFGAVVTPSISLVGTYDKPSVGNVYPTVKYALLTPQSFVASLGRFWKCTMVYKFTVVCSPFHQGRLRIWTDPRPFFDGNPVGINLVNSQVLNLAESHELVVEVPWQNARDVLRTPDPFRNTYALTELSFIPLVTSFTTEECNGIIVAEVLSPLCSPSAGADVTVMVEVSAKDMVLYSPVMPRSLPDGTLVGGLSWATDGTSTPYTPF